MNVKSYLEEVTIAINGSLSYSEFAKQTWLYHETFKASDYQMSLELIKKIGISLSNSNVTTVNIVGTDITVHPDINEIVSFFKTLPLKVEYIQDINNCEYDYITSIVLDIEQLKSGNFRINNSLTYLFVVESDKDIDYLQSFLEGNQLEHYEIIPYLVNDNLAFFEKNVYINKSDIENEPQKLNDIFAKQFINLNNFGKLFVAVNGEVYSNLFTSSIGLFKESFKDVIIEELSSDESSWRNIRKKRPCSDCIYQWLCPSPSNYEQAIGKPNLCHVVP